MGKARSWCKRKQKDWKRS